MSSDVGMQAAPSASVTHSPAIAAHAAASNSVNQDATVRLLPLDGLRTIAFVSVFLAHSLGLPLLWCGVDLFFVLSGFLITGILLRQKGSDGYFRTFYYRRFLRICPPYFLILLITATLLDANWSRHWYWYVFYLSNIQEAFLKTGTGYLTPMWSLAVEEQFYVLWPLLIYCCSRKAFLRFCIAFMLAAPVIRGALTLVTTTHWPVYYLLPSRLDLLAGGALLATLQDTNRKSFVRFSRVGPYISVCAAFVFLTITATVPSFRTSANSLVFNTVGYSLIGLVMFGTIAYFAQTRQNVLMKALTVRPMVYLGTISYMLYLSHKIILELMTGFHLSVIVNASVSLIIVIGWSSLSWFFIEKPLQAYKSRLGMPIRVGVLS